MAKRVNSRTAVSPNGQSEDIREVIKRHKDEWLLFEVLKTDRKKLPSKGRLLKHSKRRAVIDTFLDKHEFPVLYITYTGEKPPRGLELAL